MITRKRPFEMNVVMRFVFVAGDVDMQVRAYSLQHEHRQTGEKGEQFAEWLHGGNYTTIQAGPIWKVSMRDIVRVDSHHGKGKGKR